MTDLILKQDTKATRARFEEGERAARTSAWQILGLLGLLFSLVGGVDLALAVWPVAFRDPTWEFGTAVTLLNGLPVVALGLGLGLTSAVCLRKAGLSRVVAAVFGGLCVVVLLAGFLLLTTAPIALRGASDPVVFLGIRKAIAKGGALTVIYASVFGWLAFQGWKLSSRV